MSDRVPCDVPDCFRTMARATYVARFGRDPEGFLWICQAHWSRLTRKERRVWHRIRRIERRLGPEVVELRAWRIWAALRRRSAS